MTVPNMAHKKEIHPSLRMAYPRHHGVHTQSHVRAAGSLVADERAVRLRRLSYAVIAAGLDIRLAREDEGITTSE
jgi:hypothetical protein